jgi:hypothetical protein
MAITKIQASILYGYGYRLVDKEGKEYEIESIGYDCLFLGQIEDYPLSTEFSRVGTDYFILARPLEQLTQEINISGLIFNPSIELFTMVFKGCYDENNTLIKSESNCVKISTSIERLRYYTKGKCFIADSIVEEGETWNLPFNQEDLFQKMYEWHFDIGFPEGTVKPLK